MADMIAEGGFPHRPHVVVDCLLEHAKDRIAETTLNLRPEGFDGPQIKREKVVGDPVDTASRMFGLGNRNEPFNEPQLDQALECPSWLSSYPILDFVVTCAAGRDRLERGAR